MTEQPQAIVFVDGEEFCRLWDTTENAYKFFRDTQRELGDDWREIALMVWKPRYGVYLREKLVMR